MKTISERFDCLDAIRGIAALMVLTRHTTIFGASGAESHSYLAVDLFFILSGFVIAHAYERNLLSGALTATRFMAIRLVRLYPMFLVAVCLATLVALTRPAIEPSVLSKWTPSNSSALEILTSAAITLFFLPSRLGDSVLLFPLNTAFWSLMFEVVVNALYALTYDKLSTKVLLGVVIGSALCLSVLTLRGNGLEQGWSWGLRSLAYGMTRATFGFSVGILLLRLYLDRAPIRSNSRSLLVLCLVCVPLALPDLGRLNGIIDGLAVLLIFPLGIWIGAQLHASGALLRCFIWLGAASYPIYVLHVPLLILFERYAPLAAAAGQGSMAIILPLVFLIGLCMLAVVLDRYYDQRVRKAIMNRFDLRATKTTTVRSPRSELESQRELARYDEVLAAYNRSLATQGEPSERAEMGNELPGESRTSIHAAVSRDQNSRPEPSASKS